MGNLFTNYYRSNIMITGKTVVITGANTGIGKITALELCRRGGRIIIACRDIQKGKEAAKEIMDDLKGQENIGNIIVVHLDLTSLASVRECAANLLKNEPQINILINNAGIMFAPFELTEDGYELQFATNHLGHYLLTLLLLPRILSSIPARIVNVSSIAHRWCSTIQYDDINMINNYNIRLAYFRSKAANVLFTKELSTRLEGRGVNVYAVHPGFVQTKLWRHSSNVCVGLQSIFMSLPNVFVKTPVDGAQTSIYCAISDEAASETGLYYSDCRPENPSSFVRDPNEAKVLFIKSAEYVKLDLSSYDPFSPDNMN